MAVTPRHQVRVCTGLSCRARGSGEHLRALEDRLGVARGRPPADGRPTLEEAACLGLCSLAPVVEVDGVCHGTVGAAALERLPRWFRSRSAGPADVGPADVARVRAGDGTARQRLAALRAQAEARARARPALRVLVQGGSCGEALGAGETLRALRLLAAMRGLDAEVLDGACHGMCAAGIVVEVQRAGWPPLTFTHLTTGALPDLLAAVAGREPLLARFQGVAWNGDGWHGLPPASRHPFFARQRRVILDRCGHLHPVSLDDALVAGSYRALAAALEGRTPAAVLAAVTTSAGPALRAAAATSTAGPAAAAVGPASLVVYAEEGAPGLFADRHLMEGDPHRILEGLLIAAYATGATRAVIHVNGAARFARARMTRALAQTEAAGLLGRRILGSDLSVQADIVEGARGFGRGEERALLSSLATPPTGSATVISNVAPLAALPPLIAGEGGRAGPGTGPTRLWGVSGAVEHPGIVEVDGAVTLRQLLADTGSRLGRRGPSTRVLVVGPGGVPVPPESLDAPLESLDAFAAGAGGVIVIREDDGAAVEGDLLTAAARDR